MPSKEWLRKVKLRAHFAQNKTTVLAKQRRDYAAHPFPKKEAARRWSQANYAVHPSPKKEAARCRSEANYAAHPSPIKAAARRWSAANYKSKAVQIRAAAIVNYYKKLLQKRAKSNAFYSAKKDFVCLTSRNRYALADPKPTVRAVYIKRLQQKLLDNPQLTKKLCQGFRVTNAAAAGRLSKKNLTAMCCRIAAEKLVWAKRLK